MKTYCRNTSFQFLVYYVLIHEMKDDFEKIWVLILILLTHTAQYAQFNADISVFKFVKMGP